MCNTPSTEHPLILILAPHTKEESWGIKVIIIDTVFFENDNRDKVMERGMYSKFTQNFEFKRILILTKKSR